MNRRTALFLVAAFAFAGCHTPQPSAPTDRAGFPDRPEKLKFPPLKYEPPSPADFRVQLRSGPVAYLAPDRELPLVSISVHVRTGDYVAPRGKEGITDLCGYLLTKGGINSKTAEQLDERLAFLAANLNSSIGDTQGSVSLNLLSKDLDEGLAILRETLTEPRFQEDKIALRKQQLLQSMAQRNDDSAGIEFRERRILAYGEKFWINQLATKASVEAVKRDDLVKFHRDWFHPANFIVTASGDFDRAAMLKKLEALFANWPFKGKPAPKVPGGGQLAAPGAYVVDKEVNQGRVSVLLPGITREDPDYFAATMMNDILGGGGFSSRLVNRVRSEEGLAYSAFSAVQPGIYYSQPIIAGFQSKSRTVSYAISLVLDEMKKLAGEPVTAEELNTAKKSFTETFPRSFATKAQIVGTFAQDEFTGRYAKEPDYWKNYRAKIEAVTAADVLRVAKRLLKPDQAAILVVGEKKDILLGHPNHPVSLPSLVKKDLVDVPLRDPMTLKPLATTPVAEKAAK
ncbi:MAG TPA: pitrilysin family protein [Verrucomicrobiae bacterium]